MSGERQYWPYLAAGVLSEARRALEMMQAEAVDGDVEASAEKGIEVIDHLFERSKTGSGERWFEDDGGEP